MRLIIDTDAGVDDAQALMLALAHPDVTIEAITTLTGNTHIDNVVPNVLCVLAVMGAEGVPVYRGATRPLVEPWDDAEEWHGADGLGNLKERPHITQQPEDEHAVNALVRLANESPGEYTLLALGPHTNLALACMMDPAFPQLFERVVFMGGAHTAHGNTTTPTAEYNIYCDPEAAHMVLRDFPHTTMVDWEATLYHTLPWAAYDALNALDSPRARFHRAMTEDMNAKARTRDPGLFIPDPLAMAVTLEPGLVLESVDHAITVELAGRQTRGQTVVYHRGRRRNVTVPTKIDMDGVHAMFERALQ